MDENNRGLCQDEVQGKAGLAYGFHSAIAA